MFGSSDQIRDLSHVGIWFVFGFDNFLEPKFDSLILMGVAQFAVRCTGGQPSTPTEGKWAFVLPNLRLKRR